MGREPQYHRHGVIPIQPKVYIHIDPHVQLPMMAVIAKDLLEAGWASADACMLVLVSMSPPTAHQELAMC